MLFGLGAVVGLVLALTGAGGSIIGVPLLMFGMGWTLTQASPVALVAVAVSATVGTLLGLRNKSVRYRAALLMAVCGIAAMPAGLYAAHRLPLLPLTLAFAAVLMASAIRVFLLTMSVQSENRAPDAACLIDPDTGRFHWTPRCGRMLAAAGIAAGLLSGLFGVGGGFLIVPALRRVTVLSMASIIATSTMVIAIVCTVTALAAAFAGHLPGMRALPFAAGAIVGMIVGRQFAARVAGPRLQQGFAVLSAGAAVAVAARAILGAG